MRRWAASSHHLARRAGEGRSESGSARAGATRVAQHSDEDFAGLLARPHLGRKVDADALEPVAAAGPDAKTHPVDAGHQRRAAGGRGGLQRQPGPPPVPSSAERRFPGLRRRRPAAPVAGLHLAGRPVDPVGHAAGPRARFLGQRLGQRVAGDPGSRYRPPGGSCGYPADVSATTSQRSSSEALSSWIARSCAPSSISFS